MQTKTPHNHVKNSSNYDHKNTLFWIFFDIAVAFAMPMMDNMG